MKKFKIIVSVLCIVLCISPFAGMAFARTDTTSENRQLAQFPDIIGEQGFNYEFLGQLGEYFEDRYAGRNFMINADSLIQGDMFRVSNAGTVVKGSDGWLYYSDTVDDYISKPRLSENGVRNAARNIAIMQSYIRSKGAEFIFAVAPNKNSLYPENMPYYYRKSYGGEKTIKAVKPLLEENQVNCVDLFSLFEDEKETLYLKRDSHWNNKGALMVYNAVMDNLNLSHNDYSTTQVIREKKEIGDLNKMLYPVSAEPEWNYYYQFDCDLNYVTDTKSVEDAWIETKSDAENGTLLMFRDSFGNTLIPFFAREFSYSYFSKGTPYLLESYIDKYKPDYVIVEKVERNLNEFSIDPPVLSMACDYKPGEDCKTVETSASLNVSNFDGDSDYIVINGSIDEEFSENYSDIYLSVGDKMYTAFSVSDENGDNGYRVYLKKDSVPSSAGVSVIVSSDNGDTIVKSDKVNFEDLG